MSGDVVQRKLEAYRAAHEGGDPAALTFALYWCARAGVAPPRWAERAVVELARGPRKHAAAHRQALEEEPAVWCAVNQERARNAERARGERISGDALFDVVGEQLGMSGAQAKKRYYDFFHADDPARGGAWACVLPLLIHFYEKSKFHR